MKLLGPFPSLVGWVRLSEDGIALPKSLGRILRGVVGKWGSKGAGREEVTRGEKLLNVAVNRGQGKILERQEPLMNF